MSSRYIDFNLISELVDSHGNVHYEDLQNLPTADVRQNVHGKWILNEIQNEEDNWNDNYSYICSNCEYTDTHSRTVKVPFCWHCGAIMRGES